MQSAICTLFEGHYHYGVVALVNSLYSRGFKGSVYAGYRGKLPQWASGAKENDAIVWPGAKTLDVAQVIELHFIPLVTDYHFTNYKPDFLLSIFENFANAHDALFYFDPDIVISAPWSFFEDWIRCGIALCEDINSPLQENHPRRVAWRKSFSENGINLKFKNSIYVNGGFIGLSKADLSFFTEWRKIQEAMAPKIGGLGRSALTGLKLPKEAQGPFAPFSKTDQDALNATVEAWTGEISFVGKEGMAFKSGAPIMTHALGQPKPWHIKPIKQAFAGNSPRLVDRNYWNSVTTPIPVFSRFYIRKKNFTCS